MILITNLSIQNPTERQHQPFSLTSKLRYYWCPWYPGTSGWGGPHSHCCTSSGCSGCPPPPGWFSAGSLHVCKNRFRRDRIHYMELPNLKSQLGFEHLCGVQHVHVRPGHVVQRAVRDGEPLCQVQSQGLPAICENTECNLEYSSL